MYGKNSLTEIYFVRHAQPNYDNHNDLTRELSPKGEQDCQLVCDFFSDIHIDAVVSSPFKRAIDTVRGVASQKGLQIKIIEDFRERKIDEGWIDDFISFSKRQWEDFLYKLDKGENLREVQTRNVQALQAVISDYRGKAVIIGSHGTALSTIVNYYNDWFGWKDFERIKGIMPWCVHFTFNEDVCIKIEEYDFFEKRGVVIYGVE